MIDFHARSSENLGLREVLQRLLLATWLAERELTGAEEAVWKEVNEVVLRRLVGLAGAETEPATVRAIAETALSELCRGMSQQPNGPMRAWAAREIQRFFSRLHGEAKPTEPVATPPGSPIG